MGVIVEMIVYVIVDLVLLGLASILVPLVTFGRARVAAVDAPGTFPLHGFRRAEDGRIEIGRSQASLYALLAIFVLLALWLTLITR